MELTRDNYYSCEADIEYMSCSQYQGWCECEAKQLAKLQGRWIDEPCDAFIVGNYFHTHFESPEAHEQFINENADLIFLKQTKEEARLGIRRLRAPFELAEKMIATAENDELISSLIALPGENEKIMHGILFGVPWRTRLDKYVPAGRMIIDWKTCANISELKWSNELHEKVTFIDTYGYMMRAAVYSEIEKQFAKADTDPHFIIAALSKQEPPDKEVLSLNHRQRYDYELSKIKDRLPYIQRVKTGNTLPKRCGLCDYCRSTKKLWAIKPYYALMPEFREARDDDYGTGEVLADSPPTGNLDNLPTLQSDAVMGQG
ncbi:MAG: PD-(D/E)XK nuclease-like domain-containing protein [Bacteroides sp.]